MRDRVSVLSEEEEQYSGRPRLPRGEQVLGFVEDMLGANRIEVRCLDGKTRQGRIPGKMRKRVWIQKGDVVLLEPWDWQDDKADVKWRYTQQEIRWLRENGYLDI